ncbi:heat shock protein beta-9 [Saccopteryx leptura]|uniref:heat shock protein beta-9 n=1 Tax=Saccopteryx leptura TaxID=249018 RepID=UPI00339C44C2
MQQVGSGLPNGSRVASQSPSAALAEQNQGATLPVLRDDVARRDNVHTESRFQMKVDAHSFTPKELVVRVDRQCLMVISQRQMKSYSPDGSSYCMEQKMHQQMLLPRDLDPAARTCCPTPSGKLCVQGRCPSLHSPGAPPGQSLRPRGRGSKTGSNLA